MWRVTFEGVRDPLLVRALIDCGTVNGCIPVVERLDEPQPGLDERLGSTLWLISQIMQKLGPRTARTWDGVCQQLIEMHWQTLGVIAGLTLERFLIRECQLAKHILEVMAENEVVFADGADPRTFLGNAFKKGEPSSTTHRKLIEFGLFSWAMLRFVSARFLIDKVPQVRAGRVGEIRTALIARGLPPLKGE